MVFTSRSEDEPSKASIELEDRSEEIPSSWIRDWIFREETPDWICPDDVVDLPISTDYLDERSIDESELHTLIILLSDERFRYVVEHCATVIIDIVPKCFSPLLVFWKDVIKYSLPLKCFF